MGVMLFELFYLYSSHGHGPDDTDKYPRYHSGYHKYGKIKKYLGNREDKQGNEYLRNIMRSSTRYAHADFGKLSAFFHYRHHGDTENRTRKAVRERKNTSE